MSVTMEIENGVMVLRIDRSKKRNALTQAMYATLADGLDRADADDDVRVVLITGTGVAFTAGNDLQDFLQTGPVDESSPVSRFLHTIATCKTPLVAAVNGMAVGVGVTMLLHCELVYSAESAIYNFAFTNLGLVPEAASSYLLPRIVGYQKAAELLMLGAPFDAETAHDAGIVNAVYPDEQLFGLAHEHAMTLAGKPAAALKQTKMLLKRGWRQSVIETMQVEGELFAERLASAETQQIMMRFLTKK